MRRRIGRLLSRCRAPDCDPKNSDIRRPTFGRKLVCNHCQKRIHRDLHEVGRAVDILTSALMPAKSPTERVSGSGTVPLPVRMSVVELRDQIKHDLRWWAALVVRERGLTIAPDPAPHVVARWLAHHLDWLAERDDILELGNVLRGHRWAARAARDIPPDKSRFPVGPCPELLAGEVWRGRCTGVVWVHLSRDPGEKPSRLACKACGREWPRGWAVVGPKIRTRLRENRMGNEFADIRRLPDQWQAELLKRVGQDPGQAQWCAGLGAAAERLANALNEIGLPPIGIGEDPDNPATEGETR